MSTWEERMSALARRRARYADDEAHARDSHCHGTWSTCPCGAEVGLISVVFVGGLPKGPCTVWGKPLEQQGNREAFRSVERHLAGCPAQDAVAITANDRSQP